MSNTLGSACLILLVITCLALGSPFERGDDSSFNGDSDSLVLAVSDDKKQTYAVVNDGDARVEDFDVKYGDNYRYEIRHFDQGGGYQFGYNSYNAAEDEAELFRHEVGLPDEVVLGRYGYKDPYGDLKVTNYIADKDGYRLLQPGDTVEIEFAINNKNVEGNEERGRLDIVDESEAEIPIIHAVEPQGATNLQYGPHSYGYFLPIH